MTPACMSLERPSALLALSRLTHPSCTGTWHPRSVRSRIASVRRSEEEENHTCRGRPRASESITMAASCLPLPTPAPSPRKKPARVGGVVGITTRCRWQQSAIAWSWSEDSLPELTSSPGSASSSG
eukprot:scaffold238811_cov31-Tisochrysis_lutea.AAC.4